MIATYITVLYAEMVSARMKETICFKFTGVDSSLFRNSLLHTLASHSRFIVLEALATESHATTTAVAHCLDNKAQL